jgi:hypothetical protein
MRTKPMIFLGILIEVMGGSIIVCTSRLFNLDTMLLDRLVRYEGSAG